MGHYSIEDGAALVRAARYAIELSLRTPGFDPDIVQNAVAKYTQRHGVFVTLEHYPTMALRGRIGFPLPIDRLNKLLIDAAIGACVGGSEFVPLSLQELGDTVVEVSVIFEPVELRSKTVQGRKNEVVLGRDGLMIHYGFRSAVVLPSVPLEQKWNKERLFEELCISAGMERDMWKRSDVKISKFAAQTFREASPEGEVVELSKK